ncbi:MAG: redoxin domain-containing protein [Pirellulales bacterium]|nr:redoxin domain-containing protein [Pirellulales bacterium]
MLGVGFAGTALAGEKEQCGIARLELDPGSLRDILGRQRIVAEFDRCQALVLCFLGTDCPLANRLVPGVLKLAQRYSGQPVQFLAIYPHEHETIDLVAAHAADYELPFPVLKDVGQKLADALDVKRTPTFCVLDHDLELRYRGRFSDQCSVGGGRRPAASREDLASAIDDVLAGNDVRLAETPVDGCLLDRALADADRQSAAQPISYEAHIAPLLARRCATCHRENSAAPFALAGYDDAVRWGAMMREVVVERRMPPWHADARYGQFSNDRSLTKDEIKLLVRWIDAGLPRGEVAAARAAAMHVSHLAPVAARRSWSFQPEATVTTERSFQVPADGTTDYIFSPAPRAVTDELFTKTRWVQAAELRPAEPGVVHHVMVFTVEGDHPGPPKSFAGTRVVAMWAPGDPSFAFPAGTALRIPAGVRLLFNIHYTPNGRAVRDRPTLALKFAAEPPQWEVAMQTYENASFRIAPGDPHARGEYNFAIAEHRHARLVGLYPHMHVRGKSFRFENVLPDGSRETLLSVPRYDFNWQTMYWFKEPIELPIGSTLRGVARWDNSRHNPDNPDPEAEVRYGWQTNEEMMIAAMMFIFPREDEPAAPPE